MYENKKDTTTNIKQPPTITNNTKEFDGFTTFFITLCFTLIIYITVQTALDYKNSTPFPESGSVDWFIKKPVNNVALLKIDATRNKSKKYVVHLNKFETHEYIARIYINGGDVSVTPIPFGRYKIRISSGKFWISKSELFGLNTNSIKLNESLDFYINNNHTINKVINVN